ncbi:MAG: ABC transporter permease [Nocardioidaceae bacterium]
MSTATAVRAGAVQTGILAAVRRHQRLWAFVSVVALWVVVWAFTRGSHTLAISNSELTDIHLWFRRRTDWIEAAASSNSNVFINALGSMSDAANWVISRLQELFTVGAFPRPVPQIGWLGVLALAMWLTYAAAGVRMVPLVAVSFFLFGALGYWEDSLDLLIVTFAAVLAALVIGIPLGVWMGHSKVVSAVVTPVLDVLQTMPSFVYLLPFAILFGIGAACATIVTLVYALPPVVRITAFAIRNVSQTTIEATNSLGQTTLQRLRSVEVPMAKRTIIVGVNQTMMAALAMATIAAYVDGPGLGQPVLDGLKREQLGVAFVAGICIVIMAIMLDRTTTAASVRAENATRSGGAGYAKRRRLVLAAGAVLTVAAVIISNRLLWANTFPTSVDLGTPIQNAVDSFGDWLRSNLSGPTTNIQVKFTDWFLNPMQDLIANSPWFVTGLALCGLAAVVGGVRALIATVICLGGIYAMDLWYDAMVTLTSVVVATVVVMLLAVTAGVWMGRSKTVDNALRPLLDAGQTLPPFVYLVPILILFGANRFTAIVAGIIYAAPPAIKLVADGIRGVSATTVEAAEAAGTNRWQMITKVQLPMARGSLLLAANQGLLYVLSMVVIGGMVGAGALGFDIVTGFRQANYIGRGLAAGISIVLIGILLDRITTAGAAKQGAAQTTGPARIVFGPARPASST